MSENRAATKRTARQHTPGPYKLGADVHENKVGVDWEVPIFSDNGPDWGKMAGIAIAPTRQMARANARLFAAAPEMAEALSCAANILFLLRDDVRRMGFKADKVEAMCRAALKKAGYEREADRG